MGTLALYVSNILLQYIEKKSLHTALFIDCQGFVGFSLAGPVGMSVGVVSECCPGSTFSPQF